MERRHYSSLALVSAALIYLFVGAEGADAAGLTEKGLDKLGVDFSKLPDNSFSAHVGQCTLVVQDGPHLKTFVAYGNNTYEELPQNVVHALAVHIGLPGNTPASVLGAHLEQFSKDDLKLLIGGVKSACSSGIPTS